MYPTQKRQTSADTQHRNRPLKTKVKKVTQKHLTVKIPTIKNIVLDLVPHLMCSVQYNQEQLTTEGI
jgi:hypothetical protein